MIGYALVGTSDLAKATAFYDALFADIDHKKIVPNDRIVLWSTAPGKGMFGVAKPFDGEAGSVGNGAMMAIMTDSVDQVNAMHAKALELGGSNEGDPGPRGGGQMHFCYFRDLDGNKIALYAMIKA